MHSTVNLLTGKTDVHPDLIKVKDAKTYITVKQWRRLNNPTIIHINIHNINLYIYNLVKFHVHNLRIEWLPPIGLFACGTEMPMHIFTWLISVFIRCCEFIGAFHGKLLPIYLHISIYIIIHIVGYIIYSKVI